MRRVLSCHPKQMGLQSILCIGIALSNRCKLPIIPTDLFPRDLAEIIQKPYARVKITFDVTCLLVTACLTYFALGRILGLGIGTVAAAFTMGKGVAIAGSFIDKKMTFISFLHKASDNDNNTFHLPRQDKRVDCISPQRGAVSGQITAYKKVRYYGIATNEVLEPKI